MSELRRHMCPDCGREGDDAHLWCDACGGLTSFSRQMADDVYELEDDSPPPHDVTDAENMDFAHSFMTFVSDEDGYEEWDGFDPEDDGEGL
jgi:hypothetical protein